MNGSGSDASCVDDVAMAVLTGVALLASFVSTAAALAVAVAVVIVGCVAMYEPIIRVVSSVGSAAVVTALGGRVVRVVVLAI